MSTEACPRCGGVTYLDDDGDRACLICGWSALRREPTATESARMAINGRHRRSTLLADGTKMPL